MGGSYHNKLAPKAAEWGFAPEAIEEMIARAAQPPSYWSQQSTA